MKKLFIIIAAALLAITTGACAAKPAPDTTENTAGVTGEAVGDKTYKKQDGVEVIYLAGGCFWGLEKLMETLPGVTDATSGYANGAGKDPTYATVSGGNSGYRETVRVEYSPDKVSLDMILFTFFQRLTQRLKTGRATTWVRSTSRGYIMRTMLPRRQHSVLQT